MTRTIDAIVEEQAHRWQLRREDCNAEVRCFVVTVSRLHGARGGEVARTLVGELGFDLFDCEVI
jgi:hypothetical protein